jgi:hypothetical protein
VPAADDGSRRAQPQRPDHEGVPPLVCISLIWHNNKCQFHLPTVHLL